MAGCRFAGIPPSVAVVYGRLPVVWVFVPLIVAELRNPVHSERNLTTYAVAETP